MLPFISIFFIPLFISLFSAFILFDKILRYQYDHLRELWEQTGRPHGYFWIPRESKYWGWFPRFGSEWARDKVGRQWLFQTPDWMKDNPQLLQWLHWYRLLILLWIILVPVIFLVVVLHNG